MESAARQIREGFSYENRVFILMKVCELASTDQMEEVERETARAIGQENRRDDRRPALKKSSTYPMLLTSNRQTNDYSILRAGDDIPGYSDIISPYQRLELEIRKSIYLRRLRSQQHPVSVWYAMAMAESQPQTGEQKLHNQNITIREYTINHEDLNFYFQP